ncbi:molybdate transport system regulatory protein [Cricetibacter osteomyelitidis]|uniref:Molybdate transport system regulatory protein n=1 Tax=Cricetibacter osteomyelitidis TaxID=1521931 RepID=A0A4R2TF35_9PAST|nr:TOBE domain-containing protein [Cricetibacter osteomyelitidis]TCP93322.1 molybdate transport system regulatory protein [Cricetibacter osteomyelitidis]
MLESEILLTIKLQQQLFVDPKRIKLLKEIQQCGSINQAAKNAKVSYKSAWDHLQAMNEISPHPLLERNTGGKNGGGTSLTTYALRLLQLYDFLQQTQEKAFAVLQDENVPLESLLSATARFSLQSSARNQLIGNINKLTYEHGKCLVEVRIGGLIEPLYAEITEKSAVRLQLVSDKEIMLMIKAPWIKIIKNTEKNEQTFKNLVKGNVTEVTGKDKNEVIIDLGNNIEICAIADENISQGEQVWIHIEPDQIVLATLL